MSCFPALVLALGRTRSAESGCCSLKVHSAAVFPALGMAPAPQPLLCSVCLQPHTHTRATISNLQHDALSMLRKAESVPPRQRTSQRCFNCPGLASLNTETHGPLTAQPGIHPVTAAVGPAQGLLQQLQLPLPWALLILLGSHRGRVNRVPWLAQCPTSC